MVSTKVCSHKKYFNQHVNSVLDISIVFEEAQSSDHNHKLGTIKIKADVFEKLDDGKFKLHSREVYRCQAKIERSKHF